jgi:DNA-binding NarL/FixJ family response regulator
MATILIVDNRPAAVLALTRVFDSLYDVLASSTSGALRHIDTTNGTAPPDLVILDIGAPENRDIPELVTELRARDIPVVFLSCEEKEAQPVTAYAEDLITKPFDMDELLNRVQRLVDASSTQLTPRQAEVLALMASGYSDHEIAAELDVSVHTVRHHVKEAGRRLGANNRAHMLSLAVSQGIVMC